MHHPHRLILITTFLILQAASALAAEPPQIVITTNGALLSVTGLSPNAPVVILAGWWTKSYGSTDAAQILRDATASAAGEVALEFDRLIPNTALIAVADVASGRVAIADVGQPRFRRSVIPVQRFRRGAEGDYDDVTLPHEHALVVVIRAGVGAWLHRAGDGGIDDHDARSDGWIRTDPGRMKPIAQSPPAPKKLKPRDVVLVLDTNAWSFESTEVPQ